MPRSLRPIGHEDRLSLVDHLDELRTRLIICAGALAVAFGVCFWQNHELLRIINKPLLTQTRKQVAKGEGTVGQAVARPAGGRRRSRATRAARCEVLAAPAQRRSPRRRARSCAPLSAAAAPRRRAAARASPKATSRSRCPSANRSRRRSTVAFYFALVLSLPVILYELFALRAARR